MYTPISAIPNDWNISIIEDCVSRDEPPIVIFTSGYCCLSSGTKVRKTSPRASRDAIDRGPDGLRIHVTAVPENGKANAAVVKILAKALGIPKSRLTLVRGETGRDKVFRIEP